MKLENLNKEKLGEKMIFNRDARELLKEVMSETCLKRESKSISEEVYEERIINYKKALRNLVKEGKLIKEYNEMARAQ